jgi:zinc/manganese transport system permease protein
LPFAQHALLATALVAISCGILAPFVINRGMAFAVHGISELAFTGAAAGLLLHNDPIDGALAGGIIVAVILTVLGSRERERDSSIGVILAFGLGVGVLLLSFYHGFAAEATNILFGDIFGVSLRQVRLLLVIAAGVIVTLAFVYRPREFS